METSAASRKAFVVGGNLPKRTLAVCAFGVHYGRPIPYSQFIGDAPKDALTRAWASSAKCSACGNCVPLTWFREARA